MVATCYELLQCTFGAEEENFEKNIYINRVLSNPNSKKMESKTQRKLASIQKVLEIRKHGNADTLDIATICGWQVVVKRGKGPLGLVALLLAPP